VEQFGLRVTVRVGLRTIGCAEMALVKVEGGMGGKENGAVSNKVMEQQQQGEVTLNHLARRMAEFAADREWDQFHSPRNLLLALVGEVGELSEIFQWKGEVARGLGDWNEAEKEHLGEELSDVLLYLVRLADVCNVDLGDSAVRKLQKNAIKYPVELCKGNSRKYRDLSSKGYRRNAHTAENKVFNRV